MLPCFRPLFYLGCACTYLAHNAFSANPFVREPCAHNIPSHKPSATSPASGSPPNTLLLPLHLLPLHSPTTTGSRRTQPTVPVNLLCRGLVPNTGALQRHVPDSLHPRLSQLLPCAHAKTLSSSVFALQIKGSRYRSIAEARARQRPLH